MEGYSRKDETCPQLLDLLEKESKKSVVKMVKMEYETNHHGFSDEKNLQLSLGPPGGDSNNFSSSSSWSCYQAKSHHQEEQKQKALFLQNLSVTAKESSHNCCNITAAVAEKKGFSPTPAVPVPVPAPATNTAQKRTAPAPVVGWPPIRSFRKNLASSSSSLKPVSEPPNVVPTNKDSSSKKTIENNCQKGQFVKINMDGIPIGRKVDLKAYDTYQKLSSAVDQLFRGLLSAQSDGKKENKEEGEKAITGLLDGTGEYTLLYEDNEGDRMLVGNDVPWHMFVSTVKRLRVLKRSELPMLCRGAKHGKISL